MNPEFYRWWKILEKLVSNKNNFKKLIFLDSFKDISNSVPLPFFGSNFETLDPFLKLNLSKVVHFLFQQPAKKVGWSWSFFCAEIDNQKWSEKKVCVFDLQKKKWTKKPNQPWGNTQGGGEVEITLVKKKRRKLILKIEPGIREILIDLKFWWLVKDVFKHKFRFQKIFKTTF